MRDYQKQTLKSQARLLRVGHSPKGFLQVLLVIVAFLALDATPVMGETKTFTGTGDGSGTIWEDPFNWAPFGVPDADDDVIIDKAGAGPCSPPFCVNPPHYSNSCLINSDVTVRSIRVVHGYLQSNGKTITLTGSASGQTAFINHDTARVKLNILDSGYRGVHNTGYCFLYGQIAMTESDGIYNTGHLQMEDCSIGSNGGSIGSHGIVNQGIIDIIAIRVVNIDNTGTLNLGHGILNLNNGQINLEVAGTSVIHKSVLNIGRLDGNIGDSGIYNEGADIVSQGIINIDNVAGHAIENRSAGTINLLSHSEVKIGEVSGSVQGSAIVNTGAGTVFHSQHGPLQILSAGTHAIQNSDQASFIHDHPSVITIDHATVNGIYNLDLNTTFTNNSQILINGTGSGNGVVNNNGASFLNQDAGELKIGQGTDVIAARGIVNMGTDTEFINRDGGKIWIDRVGPSSTLGDAILNQYFASLVNETQAKIYIGNLTGEIGNSGIYNRSQATITLTTNSLVSIDRTGTSGTGYGFRNEIDSDLLIQNDANLHIGRNGGNVNGPGLYNHGSQTSVVATFGGVITIDETNASGIENLSGAIIQLYTNSQVHVGRHGGNIGSHGVHQSGNARMTYAFGTSLTIDHTGTAHAFFNTNHSILTIENFGSVLCGLHGGNVGSFYNDNTSSVTTESGSFFKISNTANDGIINYGSLDYHGNIEIGVAGPISGKGISNHGTIDNGLQGNILMTASGAQGIHNTGSGSSLSNSGSIEIYGVGLNSLIPMAGILNLGTLLNDGEIAIGQSSDPINGQGIRNEYVLQNLTGGVIDIHSTNAHGILNSVPSGVITNAGHIDIDHTSLHGIMNQHEIVNSGSLIIGTKSGSNDGIYNTGYLLNQAAGQILIRDVGSRGVENGASAMLTNHGLIQVDSTSGSGIFVQGAMNNHGVLEIGMHGGAIGFDGLQNEATFSNAITGELYIRNTSRIGLTNGGGAVTLTNNGLIQIDSTGSDALFNDRPFYNTGLIEIGTLDGINSDGVQNESTFDNQSGGVVSVNQAGGHGLLNGIDNSNFINSGNINIDGADLNGLYNLNTFTNHLNITLGHAGTGIAGTGIRNEGIFDNADCLSVVNILSDNSISDVGDFTNNGTVIERASGGSFIQHNNKYVQNLNGGTFVIVNGNNAITNPAKAWLGCINSLWGEPHNWTDKVKPTAGDDVLIPDYAIDPVVMQSAEAKTIEIEPGAIFEVNLGALLHLYGQE